MERQNVTTNIKLPNNDLEKLRLYFPHCFDKNGQFDIEKFQHQLKTQNIELKTENESYSLNWLGKSYARLLASDPATTLLTADKTHNSQRQNKNAQNLLINGDNLEVLKHLANAYYEKIKMIYIDPPYNTGNDGFVYQDDRKFTVNELSQFAGIDKERAKRILDFTQSKSNSHSAWLTFMYPRLYIAKHLLKEDGIIFISIDDNEVAQLRLLMDEIFGEENFVENVVWKKRSGPPNDKVIASVHEYILVYSKSKQNVGLFRKTRNKQQLSRYKNPDNHSKGLWSPDNLMSNIKGGRYVHSLYFPITNPNTGEKHFPSSNGNWRFNQEKIKHLLANNEIYFGEDGKGRPKLKRFLIDVKNGIPFSTLWDNVGFNNSATSEILELFGSVNIFDTPKPVGLIMQVLELSTQQTDIILDFFAGSGTTGDAVMQLNAEDGGNRNFILVQLPEPIDPKKNKTAYEFVESLVQNSKNIPTIFEITKERLTRASKKINNQLEEKNKTLTLEIEKLKTQLQTDETKAEIGNLLEQINQNSKRITQNQFQIYETTPIWEDYQFEAEQFDSSQTLFDIDKLTEEEIGALLTTWKTYDGIPLTQELASIELLAFDSEYLVEEGLNSSSTLKTQSYISYYGNGNLYLMHKGFHTDHLKIVLEKIDSDKQFNPTSIIVFGYHFDSKNLRELSESVKSYSNKKNIDIDLITRY